MSRMEFVLHSIYYRYIVLTQSIQIDHNPYWTPFVVIEGFNQTAPTAQARLNFCQKVHIPHNLFVTLLLGSKAEKTTMLYPNKNV